MFLVLEVTWALKGGSRPWALGSPQHRGHVSGLWQPELCVNGHAVRLSSVFCAESFASGFWEGWRWIDWPRQAGEGPEEDRLGRAGEVSISLQREGLREGVHPKTVSQSCGYLMGETSSAEFIADNKTQGHLLQQIRVWSLKGPSPTFIFPVLSWVDTSGWLFIRMSFPRWMLPGPLSWLLQDLCTFLCMTL